MICPACNTDLNGGLIYTTMLAQNDGDKAKALASAEMYGATETTGNWGRQIGIYNRDTDRTESYECPDCQHQWKRDTRIAS